MGEFATFLGFRHALVVLGARPGVAPRQAVLHLADATGLDEREAFAIFHAAPVRLYRDMPLAEAARWQMKLEAAGIACTIQAESVG